MEAGKGQLPSRFYETISHPSDHPIRISTLFMKRHGDSLGDAALLRCGGIEWKIGLRDINAGTWLDKGWRSFVGFYSIKEDYLLMFKYKGHSRFLVTICDKTANEIVYPVDPDLQTAPVKVEPDSDGDVKPDCGVPWAVANGRRLRKRIAGADPDGSGVGIPRAPPHSNPSVNEKLRACEREFKSIYPFFACSLKASYVFKFFTVGVPVKFCNSNFGASGIRRGLKFNIRVSGENKKWPVVLKNYQSNGTIRGAGWKQLAQEKGLTVGEVCIFELVKKERVFNFYRCS